MTKEEVANQKQQTKQEIAEPKSENKKDTHKAAEKASARVTPKSYDDDDEFRGDAPTSSAQRVSIPEKKTDAGKDTGKRVLKPLRNRAEIVDVLDKRDRIVASSFKLAKWYNDESGKIVLKFPSVFDIDRAKQFGGEEVFLSVLSSVMDKPVLKNDVLYEADGGTEANEKIDQIIDAIQGI